MPLLDSSQFLKQVNLWKDFPELILLAGEEDSILKDHLKEISAQFLKLYGGFMADFNCEKFRADSSQPQSVIDSCLTLPCGSNKKLVILEHLEKFSPSSKSMIEDYCKTPSSSTVFVMTWGTKLNTSLFNSAFVSTIAQKGVVSKYWKLFEEKRPLWIKDEFAKGGHRISKEAAQLLSDEGGETLSELKNEIEKLKLFCAQTQEISIDAVKESMSFKRAGSLWNFIECLENGEIKEAGKILRECLAQGEEPVKIIYFIARSLRKSSSKISKETLKRLFHEIKRIDSLLKSGDGLEGALFEQLLNEYLLSGFC